MEQAELEGVVARLNSQLAERDRAEQALRADLAGLAAMIETAPEALVRCNSSGRIVLVNRQVELLFGHARTDLIGAACEVLVADHARGAYRRHRADQLAAPHRTATGVELVALRNDGTTFPMAMTSTSVDDRGEVFVTSIVRDMTSRQQQVSTMTEVIAEKETLLREMYHRVKNNLQVISSLLGLQASTAHDPSAVEILRDSQNRIRSMALVHERLFRVGSCPFIDSAGFVRSLAEALFRSYAKHEHIALRFELDDVRLPLDAAVPCGLILNELISNALKHAFRERGDHVITISMRDAGGGVELAVADNGVGLPAGFDVARAASLGMHLIGILARQLRADIDVGPGPGTRIAVRFELETGSE